MSCRTGLAKIMTATIVAMAAGRGSWGADWSETLDVNANAAYDTNPVLLPGSNFTDRSAQLVLDGNTQIATEISQLTVTPRFAIIRYDKETNLDITTGSLGLGYQSSGERSQWNLSGSAQTDSTLTSELGQTGITNVNFRRYGYNASVSYSYLATERLSWSLQGSGQAAQYNSEAQQYGLSPYKYAGIQLGPTWSFSDRLQGSIFVGTDEVSPRSTATEKDYSGSAQLKRSLNEKYSWRVSVGATRVDIAQGFGTPTSAVFELGATRHGELVQWDVSAKRAVLPIGLGLLARQDAAALSATISLSERSTLNVSCSVLRTDPVSLSLYLAPGVALGYQVYSGATFGQAAAEWQHHFSPRWALSAAYSRSRARNYSLAEWGNGNQARLGIVWQSTRL